jgi:hypothetical protein
LFEEWIILLRAEAEVERILSFMSLTLPPAEDWLLGTGPTPLLLKVDRARTVSHFRIIGPPL